MLLKYRKDRVIVLSVWIDVYMHVRGICVLTNWAVLVF